MTLTIDFLEGRVFNLLTLVFAAVGVVLTVGGLVIAIRGRTKGRRLSIVALRPAPLLTQESREVNELRIEYDGREISDPHIVTFLLDNHGDATIDSSCFDQDRPIRLEIGVRVLAILEVSIRSGGGLRFEHARKRTAVTLGPDVLKPRQGLTVQLLVDGEPDLNSSSVLQEYLTNTDVEYVPPDGGAKFQPRSKTQTFERVAGSIGLLIPPLALALLIFGPNPKVRFEPQGAHAGQTISINGSDFRANEVVRIAVHCAAGGDPAGFGGVSYLMTEVSADSKGQFRKTAAIPNVPDLSDCSLTAWQQLSIWRLDTTARQDF